MRKFRKVLKNKKSYITQTLETIIYPNLIEDLKILFDEAKHYIEYYMVNQVRGYSRFDKETGTTHFSIPVWAFERGNDYFTYYIAHELSHALVDYLYRPKKVQVHGKHFYEIFKQVCPKHLQKHEYVYKPRNAKKYDVIQMR